MHRSCCGFDRRWTIRKVKEEEKKKERKLNYNMKYSVRDCKQNNFFVVLDVVLTFFVFTCIIFAHEGLDTSCDVILLILLLYGIFRKIDQAFDVCFFDRSWFEMVAACKTRYKSSERRS